MEEIKLLGNNIKDDSDIESIFDIIVSDIKLMGKCEGEVYNDGEYTLIPPDNMLVSCRLKMNIELNTYDILLHKQTFERDAKEELNTLEVTITTDNSDDIYNVKVKVKDVLKKYYKEIFILMDTHNQIICSQLYSQIYKVENQFREVINRYMVRKYGVAWFKQNIKDEFQSKSKQYSGWYNRQYEDFRDIQSEVFNLQTDDLIKMLEKSYINQLDKSEVDAITNLKDKLKDKATLVLQNEYLNLNSIWDTDIKSMLPDDFNDLWKEFTNMRNMIAHNKPICMKLKQDIETMVKRLEGVLDSFKNRIDNRLTSLEKQEAKWIERDINDDFCCEEAGIEKLPDREGVIQEILEQDDIQELYSYIDEFISDYKGVLDEFECCIEEISEGIFEEYRIEEFSEIAIKLYDMLNKLGIVQDQSKIEIIKKAMSEEIRGIIETDLVNLFSMIDIDTENIVQSDGFDDNIIVFRYENIFKKQVEVKTSGDIFTERGSSNDIIVELMIDGKEQERGIITKWYGEYEMNYEQGYAMPIVEDSLDINIKDILDSLNNHFEETLDEINEFIEFLSSLVFED